MVAEFYHSELQTTVRVYANRNAVNITFRIRQGKLCINVPLNKAKCFISNTWPPKAISIARKLISENKERYRDLIKFKFDIPVDTVGFSIIVSRDISLAENKLIASFDNLQKKMFIRVGWNDLDSPIRQLELKKIVKRYVKVIFPKLYTTDIIAWSKRFDFDTNKLHFNSAKTRFGSCSSSGNINLSGYLAFFSKDLIEYVFAHEICHLTHMNHGPKFKSLLRKHIPDCDDREVRLREELLKYAWLFV